jgi:hypothetical protein
VLETTTRSNPIIYVGVVYSASVLPGSTLWTINSSRLFIVAAAILLAPTAVMVILFTIAMNSKVKRAIRKAQATAIKESAVGQTQGRYDTTASKFSVASGFSQ